MADNPPPPNDESAVTGDAGRRLNDAKTGIKVDTAAVVALDNSLRSVLNTVTAIRDAMKEASEASAAMSGGQAGSTSYIPSATNTSQPVGTTRPATGSQATAGNFGGPLAGLGARGGIGGGFAKAGGYLAIGNLLGVVGGGGGIGARIDRGVSYASSLDKLNMQAQQMYGFSQQQAMDYRRPLMQYKLGVGGANQLQGFQFNYGISAAGLAPQVEAMRAASGYSLGTGDVLSMQEALMRPQAANRMMRFGGSVYNPDGSIKGPMDVTKQAVRRLGLADENYLKGAMRPGSMARANLTIQGIPEEMQTGILQYAQSQVQFTKKGGKGMYDPGDPADQKLMGIDKNLANEEQETTRLRELREERFADAHLSHMARSEQLNQKMVDLLTSLDSKFSGPLGAVTKGRNILKPISNALTTGGAALMLSPGPGTVAGGVMLAAGAVGNMISGDPEEGGTSPTNSTSGPRDNSSASDGSISIPVGYGGGRKTLNEVKQRSDFKKMHPKMQERMLAMFRENPNLGIGGGWRDSAVQQNMFLDRYRESSDNTGIKWNGKYWKRVKGAPAAPPGRSMHEIGLAADLVGDLDWLQANAARFGLKTFADVNNEPWHIQPQELPNSRREYEENGSSWGTDGGFDPDAEFGGGPSGKTYTTEPVTGDANHHAGYSSSGDVGGMAGLSISQIIASMKERSAAGLVGGGATSKATRARAKAGGAPGNGSVPAWTGGTLTAEQVAKFAYEAGFRGEELVHMVAIAQRESGFKPGVLNDDLSTGDMSYGLWQLNTLNDPKRGMMGDLMNELLGKPRGNKNFDELYDPATNAAMAYQFYLRNGKTLAPWGAYRGKENTFNTDVGSAATAVANAGYSTTGDPMESRSLRAPNPSSGGTTIMNNAAPVTLNATFNVTGSKDSDLELVVDRLWGMIESKANIHKMRSA